MRTFSCLLLVLTLTLDREHDQKMKFNCKHFWTLVLIVACLVGHGDPILLESVTLTLPMLGSNLVGPAIVGGVASAAVVGIALGKLAREAKPVIAALQRLQRLNEQVTDEDIAQLQQLLRSGALDQLMNVNVNDIQQLQQAVQSGQLQRLQALTPQQLDTFIELTNTDPETFRRLQTLDIDKLEALQDINPDDLFGGGDYDDLDDNALDGDTGGDADAGGDTDGDEVVTVLGSNVTTERPLTRNEQRFLRAVNRTGTLPPRLRNVPPKVLKSTGLFDILPPELLDKLGLGDVRRRWDNYVRRQQNSFSLRDFPSDFLQKAKSVAHSTKNAIEKALYSQYKRMQSLVVSKRKSITNRLTNSFTKFGKPLRRHRFQSSPRRRPRHKRRFKRKTNTRSQTNANEDSLVSLEPIFKDIERLDSDHDCAKLYVCKLATKPKSELKTEDKVLLAILENRQGISLASSKGPFDMAARLGEMTRDENSCRDRYYRCEGDKNRLI